MEPVEKELVNLKVLVERELSDIKGCYREMDVRMDNQEKETIQIKADIKSTNTRVDSLEGMLKEITDNTKWIKRAITKGAISFIFGIVSVVIIGLVTFYIKSLGG
jgi:septal ring factor EnvC (AmiA/AmiB activator)